MKAKPAAPGAKLFPGSDGPEIAERANEFPVKTHDQVEHLTVVIDQTRVYATRLHALTRTLEGAVITAKNAAKAAEALLAHDTTAAAVGHSLGELLRTVTEAAHRQDRGIASLESEKQRALQRR